MARTHTTDRLCPYQEAGLLISLTHTLTHVHVSVVRLSRDFSSYLASIYPGEKSAAAAESQFEMLWGSEIARF